MERAEADLPEYSGYQNCLEHAAQCDEIASQVVDPRMGDIMRDIARRWRALAAELPPTGGNSLESSIASARPRLG